MHLFRWPSVKRKENDTAGAVQAEKEAFATFDELLRDRTYVKQPRVRWI